MAPIINHERPLLSLLLPVPILIWLSYINKNIPDPYLDEVFHVGQAQAYWRGQWTKWDPKITTPPALYVFSWVINTVLALLPGAGSDFGSEVKNLRGGNGLLLFLFIPRVLLLIRKSQGGVNISDAHTVLNICLFPVMFFFSGLYYTDLLSVWLVLETYHLFRLRSGRAGSLMRTLGIFLVGLASLTARQTNIFWVSVFLGGLEVTRSLPSRPLNYSDGLSTFLKTSWTEGIVHDVDIEDASVEDAFYLFISLATASLRNGTKVIPRVMPYVALLISFGGFVLWNGGVVLGDEANHIASIHLPQMLYIWPYVVFFSWSLLLPYALNAVVPPAYLPSSVRCQSIRRRLPRLGIATDFLVGMAFVVRFNTIVHPFTLADNRHYVFYVFRILLRNPWTKLLVVPVYFTCAWLAIAAFSQLERPTMPASKSPEPGNTIANTSDKDSVPRGASTARKNQQIKLSFVLVWLAATALSLITAPLVEPRYFLIPWVIWRIHLPSYTMTTNDVRKSAERSGSMAWLPHDDWRLYLETLWYLLINVVTGYLFLYRGFDWPQEPGKVQRFMW